MIKKGIDVNMIKRRKVLSLFLASVMALGSVDTSYIAHANTISEVSKISSAAHTITESNYPKISNISENTILGADFSNYQQDLIWGKTYKDYKNNDISDTLFDFVTKLMKKDNTALEIIDTVYKSGQDLKQFIKSVLKFSLDIYKYTVFKNISYTSLPDTADILNNLSNIKDVEKIVDIINLLIKIDTSIKWESDPYTMAEILIVSFIGGENK